MLKIPRVDLTSGSGADLEHVVTQLRQALGITFQMRDSMYLGGNCYRFRPQ